MSDIHIDLQSIFRSLLSMPNDMLIKDIEKLISNFKVNGYDDRERLFRKLVEEVGEYSEAIEYNHGSPNKMNKFKDIATSKEKLQEEIIDVLVITLALGNIEELNIYEMLKRVKNKLKKQEELWAKYENKE